MTPPGPTWLITGGAGFIGSNLVRFILQSRPDVHVINLDALTYAGNPDNLTELDHHPRHEFIHADIRDAQAVRPHMRRADVVLHLAAESHVDRSIADPQPFISTNVLGTQTLLDLARLTPGDRRFVYVSTDEVYGHLPLDRPDQRFTEQSPLQPRSPYAASKASADLLAQAAHHTFGLDVIVARCSNNLGPRQLPEKLIPRFITNLAHDHAVPLFGDGLHVRDWIHVDDTCEALCLLAERARPGSVYNVGAHNERSNLELTHTLLDLLGKDRSLITHVADRPGHDRRYALDAARLQHDLSWRPTRSAWPEALAETVRWYLDHPDWLERAARSLP